MLRPCIVCAGKDVAVSRNVGQLVIHKSISIFKVIATCSCDAPPPALLQSPGTQHVQHVAQRQGAGAQVVEVSALPDPCPLPGTAKKRSLNERERLLYAPMADVGGLLYDKDAVYIDVPDWKARLGFILRAHFSGPSCSAWVAASILPCVCPGPGVRCRGSMQPGALVGLQHSQARVRRAHGEPDHLRAWLSMEQSGGCGG